MWAGTDKGHRRIYVEKAKRTGKMHECGACQINCPASVINVDSRVGCAAAMISAAIRGKKEVTCGEDYCD